MIRPKNYIPYPFLPQIRILLIFLAPTRPTDTHRLATPINHREGAGRVEPDTLDGSRRDVGGLQDGMRAFREGRPDVGGGLLECSVVGRRTVSLGWF